MRSQRRARTDNVRLGAETARGALYLAPLASVVITGARVRGVQGTRITFHYLSHTFATQALIHGVDVVTVAGILGHRETSTTLRHYARWMPSASASAMERMGEVLSA